MANMWEVETDTGETWYVGSMTIPQWYKPASKAQIVIPVEQLGSLSAREIGEYVKRLVDKAMDCYEAELEYEQEYVDRKREESQRERPRRDSESTLGFLYLLKGVDTPWYKIGISKRPDIRLKQLGTKAPFDIEKVCSHLVDDMKDAESYWHERFADRRANGEWFELTDRDVDDFLVWDGEQL